MTPENGNVPTQPPERGGLVMTTPLAYFVEAGMFASPAGPVRMVRLRIEHATGSSEFLVTSDVGMAIGRGLIAASSGIEIVRGTLPPAE